jgi:hypothetical protein
MKHAHWLLLAALAAGNAVAQERKRPDPADPQAPVTPVTFKSAFEGYRSLEEPKPTPWRDANDEAARVGGHIGILREQAAAERETQKEGK